jgi:hypothetical protein
VEKAVMQHSCCIVANKGKTIKGKPLEKLLMVLPEIVLPNAFASHSLRLCLLG